MNFQTFSCVLVILSTHFVSLLEYAECSNRSLYHILAGALWRFLCFISLLELRFAYHPYIFSFILGKRCLPLITQLLIHRVHFAWCYSLMTKLSDPRSLRRYFPFSNVLFWMMFPFPKMLSICLVQIMSFELYNLVKSPDYEMGVDFPLNTQQIAFNSKNYFFSSLINSLPSLTGN